MLIDSHCHLDFPQLSSDLAGVLARAKQAGIERMVSISTTLASFEHLAPLAERHPAVFFTVGLHPNHVHEAMDPISTQQLVEWAQHPKCIGIGEAGLDYHYNYAEPAVAEACFRAQIAAARQTGLPLVIHSRDADVDMARILRDEMRQGRFNAILHCFTSSRELAMVGIELGLFISFSGILTFKNSQNLRDIAAELPIERLLIESDAPYLAPVPFRGKSNEPAYIVETALCLAQIRGLSLAELGPILKSNTLEVYNKMPPMIVE